MNDFTLDNVNEMYIDVLREIGNIGGEMQQLLWQA